jgi:dihydrofolate synthase/folylpolyglutamate synthase
MLESMCRSAGHRVGLYTSPHLVDSRERIRVDGVPIGTRELAAAAGRVRDAHADAEARFALSRPPTYFEAFTAMALHHFSERRVDVAILEVGMGGRFDATNVVTPVCSVITNVSLDHMQYLGRTVREIAQEKAGIIKPRVPVVTMARERALSVIRGRARQVGAPLHEVTAECRLRVTESGERSVARLQTPAALYEGLQVGLRGRHQVDNALLAVRAAEVMTARGIAVPERAIRTGLRDVTWPGRLDVVEGSPRMLLDAAHNPDGARTLRAYLAAHQPVARTVMLMGLTAGREPREMARLLLPLARECVVTRPPAKASVAPSRLREEATRLGLRARAVDDWEEALAVARRRCRPRDVLVVTGSLYLVGSVLGSLRHGGEARPAR